MLNDSMKEIKEALKMCADHCFRAFCPYGGVVIEPCSERLKRDALILITEQEKENERLKAENNNAYNDGYDKVCEDKSELKAQVTQAKIDVLTELKEKAISLSGIEAYHICNLADEMIKELQKKK